MLKYPTSIELQPHPAAIFLSVGRYDQPLIHILNHELRAEHELEQLAYSFARF